MSHVSTSQDLLSLLRSRVKGLQVLHCAALCWLHCVVQCCTVLHCVAVLCSCMKGQGRNKKKKNMNRMKNRMQNRMSLQALTSCKKRRRVCCGIVQLQVQGRSSKSQEVSDRLCTTNKWPMVCNYTMYCGCFICMPIHLDLEA